MIDGKYLNYDDFTGLCDQYGVLHVPFVYRGAYALSVVKGLSDGNSLLGGQEREGVVVRPVVERQHPQIGRVVLKYVGDTYLFGKAAKEDTTDQ